MKENERNKYTKDYEPWSDIVFTEPIAIPLTPVLAKLRVHPNLITVFSLLAGLASGVIFAFGHWFWAALVFQFAYLCDCLDGKVARLRQMTSSFGAKLDVFADSTRKPSSFLGIAIYFYCAELTGFAILTVLALVVHILIHKLYVLTDVLEYDLELPDFHRKFIRRISPRTVALYTFFEEQFIEFVAFPLVAAIIGLPKGAVWFFYGAVVVTVLGLTKLYILLNHRRKGRYEQIHQNWAGTGGSLKSKTPV